MLGTWFCVNFISCSKILTGASCQDRVLLIFIVDTFRKEFLKWPTISSVITWFVIWSDDSWVEGFLFLLTLYICTWWNVHNYLFSYNEMYEVVFLNYPHMNFWSSNCV